MFEKFLKDESGATAIEYTLLAALIGVALVGGMGTVTGAINEQLGNVADEVRNPGGGAE